MSARDDIVALKKRMAESIIGQKKMIERLLLGQLSRIQFTLDLLPSDTTGSEVYYTQGGKGEFKFRRAWLASRSRAAERLPALPVLNP